MVPENHFDDGLDVPLHIYIIAVIHLNTNKIMIKVDNIATRYDNLPDINFEKIEFTDLILGVNGNSRYSKFQNKLT